MTQMTPKEIVSELDKNIIGQNKAKKAVAIALRNRWRRSRVEEPLRSEITPKNILMIGPTGVGKTEIARRLAKLANAPFVKVEASKFTEVGYVGRDVDTIIRDLIEIAVKDSRERAKKRVRNKAMDAAEDRVLDALLTPARASNVVQENSAENDHENSTRQKFRKKLREGELDDKEIEIEVNSPSMVAEIFAPPGMEELTQQIQGMFSNMGGAGKKSRRKLRVADALKLMVEEEAARMINDEEIKTEALKAVEQNGIVFLDEIDKIASRFDGNSADVSRQGVQRDLLPLVEGTTVSTKYGMIKTDHILFIGSGAFHLSKPSDLIPELQGRFPIRVELDNLSVEDFVCILTQTHNCLTLQYQALLATDDIGLEFKQDGIQRLAEIAFNVNERTENIGARRLHTVMERLLEEISFEVGLSDEHRHVDIDQSYVEKRLGELSQDDDLSRYVL